MDPINTLDYARLRAETSNILKRLKRNCESDLEDLDLSLDDKRKAVLEKIEATVLTVITIPG